VPELFGGRRQLIGCHAIVGPEYLLVVVFHAPLVKICLTPLGRQEDCEKSAGRSDGQVMRRVHRHDEFEA
jgi:predicted dithiol-disulfide oxidoreductase (DUF899 family)